MKNIVIVVASEMQNLELAKKFEEEIVAQGANAKIVNIVDLDLPMFTTRSESLHNPAELLKDIVPTFKNSNGFVFLAPEYNGGTPPVLSNFLAWLSRTSKDWRENLNGKSAVIGTYSAGNGNSVLMILRTQLSYLGMNVLGRQIVTTMNKALDPESLKSVVSNLLKYSH